MSDKLTIDLQDEHLLAAIDRAIDTFEHAEPMMRDIGDVLERNVQLRFDAKVDPSGAPWAPLSPVTLGHFYAQTYPDGPPGSLLERTRQLRGSLASNAGDDFVEVGTSRRVPGKSEPFWEVGMLHEFGTRTMPRRGLLVADPHTGELGADDEADVLAVVRHALDAAFGGA